MRDALNKTGRRIFFSMCEWGVENPATWSAPVGNSWRTTGDISDNWNSFVSILDKQAGLEAYSGPGAWNDPDMLEVGNGGMTSNENEAHFVLWAVLKSPLLIGCDLSKMTNDTLRILGNEEVIAVNQDKLGKQVKRVKQETNRDYFVGPLSKDSNNNDRYVVVLFNRGTAATDFVFTLSRDIGLPTTVYATVRDIVNHKDLPDIKTDTASYASIPGRSVHALVLTILSKTQAISLTEA
jgi:alpha-galactosidase